MPIRVGLMGLGRIGRNIFRSLYTQKDIEVVAINDIAPPEAMEYLLRFDTLKGRFRDPVRIVDGYLYAGGRQIAYLQHREPGEIPWYDYGIDIVIEGTGQYRNRKELQKHLDMGADRVILTQPPVDEIDAFYIRGVSSEPVDRSYRILSCGSSTANCTATLLKVLDDAFGVENGSFTSVHAYTTEQSLIDAPVGEDLRLARAAIENIVPVSTWTDQLIVREFPHLEGKFTGMKLNVPVPDVSCVDLVTQVKSDVSPQAVNEVFRSASGSIMKDILAFTDEPIVSSDVIGLHESCLFDSLATMTVGDRMVKTIGWYDQGGGLAYRIVDLIREFLPAHEAKRKEGVVR